MTNLPLVYLARHGETAWSLSGQHTGRTDLPLTPRGEANARSLGARLERMAFDSVFTSPLQRAASTCRLAGFGDRATIDPDLLEWDYGNYEGLTSKQIRDQRPDWYLFREGVPGGEAIGQIAARADRVVKRVRALGGRVLLFSSGHFLRVLAARWLDMPIDPTAGQLLLSTASLSILSYEHDLQHPALALWNDTSHLTPT